GYALQFVKEQTPEICLEAVKQNGYALQFVKEQTPEICLEAVKEGGWTFKYVKEQIPEICLEAVKKSGWALQLVKEQTPEICLEAVKQDGRALEYVKEQTPEICLAAVKEIGEAFEYAKFQTPEMCINAIKDSNFNIKYLNSSMYKWYGDILRFSILNSNDDFSNYCFYIGNANFNFKLSNVGNEYIKNLKIIDLPYDWISKNGFLNYIVELNCGFAFIVDDSLDKEILNKLILSNNYVIGLYNDKNTKYYSNLLNYVMKEDEFELLNKFNY
ncbi:MAG: DUF4116 domain-containing protein, partial [Romboutsia sp.]|nr:DUF4116 domain-containing protein [Romboutsia sp.]